MKCQPSIQILTIPPPWENHLKSRFKPETSRILSLSIVSLDQKANCVSRVMKDFWISVKNWVWWYTFCMIFMYFRCCLSSFYAIYVALLHTWLLLYISQSTKRAGWVKRDIAGPESIADHMYRMGLMALISSDTPGVNRDKLAFFLLNIYSSCVMKALKYANKRILLLILSLLLSSYRCIKMAIVHDIAEGSMVPKYYHQVIFN